MRARTAWKASGRSSRSGPRGGRGASSGPSEDLPQFDADVPRLAGLQQAEAYGSGIEAGGEVFLVQDVAADEGEAEPFVGLGPFQTAAEQTVGLLAQDGLGGQQR